MIICHCKVVTDKELKECSSVCEAREKTGATTGCGGCICGVIEVIKNNTDIKQEEDKKNKLSYE